MLNTFLLVLAGLGLFVAFVIGFAIVIYAIVGGIFAGILAGVLGVRAILDSFYEACLFLAEFTEVVFRFIRRKLTF